MENLIKDRIIILTAMQHLKWIIISIMICGVAVVYAFFPLVSITGQKKVMIGTDNIQVVSKVERIREKVIVREYEKDPNHDLELIEFKHHKIPYETNKDCSECKNKELFDEESSCISVDCIKYPEKCEQVLMPKKYKP